MHILFCVSEVAPLAKVGGLADVAGSLPKALTELGHQVTIIMPKYDVIDTKEFLAKKILSDLPVHVGAIRESVSVWKTLLPDSSVSVYLVEHPRYLSPDGIYFGKTAFAGTFKEIQRFVFFCQAVVSMIQHGGLSPDIIHCHDWHTAMIPTFLEQTDLSLPTLLTIHNLANQGLALRSELEKWLGFSVAEWTGTKRDVNLLAHGILSARFLSTVSPTYAKEILTPEYGEHLEGLLSKRQRKLVGILNGIDQDRYNPATDPAVTVPYTPENFLEFKKQNKPPLQKQFSLPEKDVPVIGMVTRITNQKGFDLLLPILPTLFQQDLQVVILGTGDPKIEKSLLEIQKSFPDKLGLELQFDASGGRHVYAGSDLFWMPSLFEPCGLGQLIAMRYGTVPVVRKTGGLQDTVTLFNPDHPDGHGFVFNHYDAQELLQTTQEALSLYHNNPDQWHKIQRNDFSYDSSWRMSAKQYDQLYQDMTRI